MFNHVKKNNLLDFIQSPFYIEERINPQRVFELNKNKSTGSMVIYLITREFRVYDNFALNYAKQFKKDLLLVFLIPNFQTKNKKEFFDKQFNFVVEDLKIKKFKYKIFNNIEELSNFLQTQSIYLLIKDFNPILDLKLPDAEFKIIEIDGHNICPARFISNKQEYNAATFRRKIYAHIEEFLCDYPCAEHNKTQAQSELEDFIEKRLDEYSKYKNDPAKNATSNLSKFLNLGFISSQRAAIEVIRADTQRENKEAFLEELIVRKELSDNFCLYNKNFKSFNGIANWAKQTLNEHRADIRSRIYSLFELEHAKTYDDLWNASQVQLLREGKIHGYMRMYWAKKLLEWTHTPEIALKYAIYLNDKYAYDAPSPNGYVGILWSIGALHDRAFFERDVTGKIRPMTYNGAKSKFDTKKYIEKYSP